MSDDKTGTPTTGVLLINLGTPDAPTAGALRRYLREFLSDPRVVEAPRWLWWFVLNGFILPTRPARSAGAYRKIWTEQGSPLLVNSRAQLQALRGRFDNGRVRVELGMRYGRPSVREALHRLRQQGVTRIVVLPLYPQYSGSTTGSTFDAVAAELRRWRRVPSLRFIGDYHDDPAYIEAMAAGIRRYWDEHGRPEKLLLSFHGVPRAYIEKGDPYESQCRRTASRLAGALALADDQWQLVFQSRFGPQEWLQPYADKTIEKLPADGVRHIAVYCPGFASDCLETLEEMAIGNRELFLENGGERFDYIPALNDAPEHIDALAGLIQRELAGWVL